MFLKHIDGALGLAFSQQSAPNTMNLLGQEVALKADRLRFLTARSLREIAWRGGTNLLLRPSLDPLRQNDELLTKTAQLLIEKRSISLPIATTFSSRFCARWSTTREVGAPHPLQRVGFAAIP